MKSTRRRGGTLRRILLWGVVTGVLAGGIATFVVYRELTRDLPPVDQLMSYTPPSSTRIFSDDGTLIGEFFTERRYLVPLDRIPQRVRDAFLAAEDADFYRHPGVDLVSIGRAFAANVSNSGVVQGGSTITQQVVKALLLTAERSYERKAKEFVLALRLETMLPKDDILYLYLNQIYFGAGAYGIEAAARTFFDRHVEDLTVAQSALLAGLPQRPTYYDPQRHLERARARQRYVLERMRAEGFITTLEYDEAIAEPIEIAERRSVTYIDAPWYVEHVRRMLDERYGGAASQLGLRVHTAVDLRLQNAAVEALQEGLRALDKRQGYRGPIRHLEPSAEEGFLEHEREERAPTDTTQRAIVTRVTNKGLVVRTAWDRGDLPAANLKWGGRRLPLAAFEVGDVIAVAPVPAEGKTPAHFALDQEPQVEGALVALDPYTGQVKAMVGGYRFERSQFNRAIQAHRQPGSAIKPLIYAAAVNKGYTPTSIVVDSPLSFPDGSGKTWSPKNYGGKYYGAVPLRTALKKSLNTVSVRLVNSLGIDYVREYIDQFGFASPLPRNLSIALGSAEVTPLELTAAYGVFTTLGKRFDPLFVTAVTDDEGKLIDFGRTRPHFERIIEPATAYVMTSMLESVVKEGTGRAALALERPVAGKTGTTNDTIDAWFIGFTPDLIAGVWVGFDSERSLGRAETGGKAAAPIFTAFMKKALENYPVVEFPEPDGVMHAHVDGAGKPAAQGSGRDEVYVEGTEPGAPDPYAPVPTDYGEPQPPQEEHPADALRAIIEERLQEERLDAEPSSYEVEGGY
jgi:penicillin-binding protein 1A